MLYRTKYPIKITIQDFPIKHKMRVIFIVKLF